MSRYPFFLLILLLGIHITSFATEQELEQAPLQNEEEASQARWFPELELGYLSKSGNENEQSLNVRLALDYQYQKQRYSGEIKGYMKDEEGEETEYKNSYQFQSDYKLTPEIYWYGNFKGIDSNYTSYFHDYTFSTGLGYQFINNGTWLVEAELGPGYRYQSPNTDELDSNDPIFPDDVDEAIFRTSLHAKWQVFESMSLDTEITTVSGESNSRVGTDIGVTYYMNDNIALKVNHSIDYLSRVPEGLSKTDKQFYFNLLFSKGKN